MIFKKWEKFLETISKNEKLILIILNNMNETFLEKMKIILNQFWWSINLSYQTKNISNITEKLVKYHKENIHNLNTYNSNELFSLYSVLDYAIKDLWEEEFNTVTWLDLYKDWYTILNQIKKMMN